ncbi:MAG: DNA-directed DNA polymerase II small subunit [Candidatus Bathyarchaeota archaeon]|nr:DNA-directed DNA polymerase II small subunit [Candidatus Bathyarchaeota archaeon]
MNELGKLQKAVEITIAAGYQIDREAFEFLSSDIIIDDPATVMAKALQKIECLEEKPMFIGKSLLEAVLQEPEAKEEKKFVAEVEPEESTHEEEKQYPVASSPFHPYAKNVESQIKVLEDPTDNLSSNGTVGEFLDYFQDRFKRIEKLLRQRMDLKAATPISEALKSQHKAKLKIIGMVTEKREAKQQQLITIEDLNASATILVPTKASEEVQRKAQVLLPDQIICAAVVKTRSHLFLAEDIIFPEVGQKPMRRASEPVYAVLTSDIHVGSNKFNKEAFKRFVKWLNGQYGNEAMREIASHVKYCLVAGDLVDGIGVYPGQQKELTIRDVHNQYRYAAKIFSRLPEHIEIIVSPGNHDAPRKALPQPAISEDYLPTLQGSRRIYSLGNPCTVSIHGVEVLMFHGRSLDDIIGSVPGTDHEHPEKAMKLFIQGRHLAPIYGGKTTLSPEKRDFLVIDKVPDIFHAGHIHVLGMCNHRGVLVVNSGGWQEQTDYMAKLGLVPTPGKVPVVNLQTMEARVLSFV